MLYELAAPAETTCSISNCLAPEIRRENVMFLITKAAMRGFEGNLRRTCKRSYKRSEAMPPFLKPSNDELAIRNGGAEGTRTPDFLLAKEALSQLSYSPTTV